MRLAEADGGRRGQLVLAGNGVMGLAGRAHRAALGVEQRVAQREVAFLSGIVAYAGLDGQRGLRVGFLQVGIDEGAEGLHVHGLRAVEPHVAIDAGTLVEPTLLERCIDAHAHQVRVAVVQVFGHVIHLRNVAALLATQVEAVHPDAGVAEDAVELQFEVLAEVVLGDGERLAIPAHRRLGILPAHGLVAVAVAGLACKGQPYHPVVRQVDRLPARSIKLQTVRPGVVNAVGLREVVKVLGAAAEVLLRVGCVSKGKLPVFIHRLVLSRSVVGSPCCQSH